MVNMIIDGKQISAEENITIMEAAERNGIPIPKLCYLKGINEIAACRVCVVELEGKEKLITSCNNVVKDGMVIYTNSPKVRNHRRNTVQLLLSQHDNRCVVCPRNGNCQLQQVACDLNILDIPFRQEPEYQPWDKDFPLIRNSAKCIKCMRCVQVCDKIQGLGIWDVEGTGSRTTVNVAGHKTIREAVYAIIPPITCSFLIYFGVKSAFLICFIYVCLGIGIVYHMAYNISDFIKSENQNIKVTSIQNYKCKLIVMHILLMLLYCISLVIILLCI